MKSNRCKGTTSQGANCGGQAKASGYCHLHDPAVLKEKHRRSDLAATKRKALDEVLHTLTGTVVARGWSWQVDSIDEDDYKHASFSVNRHVEDGKGGQQITGFCEVAWNGGVKLSLQKTSFHGFGLAQLHEALIETLGKIPW